MDSRDFPMVGDTHLPSESSYDLPPFHQFSCITAGISRTSDFQGISRGVLRFSHGISHDFSDLERFSHGISHGVPISHGIWPWDPGTHGQTTHLAGLPHRRRAAGERPHAGTLAPAATRGRGTWWGAVGDRMGPPVDSVRLPKKKRLKMVYIYICIDVLTM